MNQSKTAILVRPRQDKPTEYSYNWLESIKPILRDKNWQIIDCESNTALRIHVENALKSSDKYLFVFYGHGEKDSLFGQDSFPVIDRQNVANLKNCTVYVMACWSAQQLGWEAVGQGAKCYLGYHEEVKIKLSLEESLGLCVNSGLLAWLYDETLKANDIYKIITNSYDYWINYFSNLGDPNYLLWASQLRHNRDALRLYGFIDATLVKEES